MWTNSAMKAYEEQIVRETLVRRNWEKTYDPRFDARTRSASPPPEAKPATTSPQRPDVSDLYKKFFKGEARPVDLVYPPSAFTKELEQQEGYVNLRGPDIQPTMESTYRSAPQGTAALGASIRSEVAEPPPAAAAEAAPPEAAGESSAGVPASVSAVLAQTQPRTGAGHAVSHGVYLAAKQPYPDLGPGFALYARSAAPSNLSIPGYQGPMDHAMHMRMWQSTQFVEERLLRTGKNPYAQDL